MKTNYHKMTCCESCKYYGHIQDITAYNKEILSSDVIELTFPTPYCFHGLIKVRRDYLPEKSRFVDPDYVCDDYERSVK